jgi:nucleoid-associated protein YgaU
MDRPVRKKDPAGRSLAFLVVVPLLLAACDSPRAGESFQPPRRSLEQLRPVVRPISEAPRPAGPTTTTVTDPSANSYQTYTIQQGDTLWSIARHLLGDGKRYRQIVQMNPDLPADRLPVGREIRIPPR